MPGPIKIAVVADVKDAARELPKLETGLKSVGDTAETEGRRVERSFDGVAESSDALASGSAQVAGGLGDLGGALSMLPGPLGSVGSGMELLQGPIMGVTGASDLLNAATEKFPGIAKVASGAARGLGLAVRFATGPVGLIVLGLAALVTGLVIAYKKSETFRDIVNGAFGAVKKVIANFTPLGIIVTHFDQIVGFVRGLPKRITGAASGMWNGIRDSFRGAINWIIDKWNGLSFSIPSIDTHIPGVGRVGGFTLSTPNIPRLARGGIVVAGDNASGIEAVVPLERAAEMGFGGGGQVVEIHLTADVLDEISRGRRYIAAINAAQGAGARSIAWGS
jgi:phage-related protein